MISHIRRLLSHKFVCAHVKETPQQFKRRMLKVQDFMNSDAFSAKDGRGLAGLAKDLFPRCEELVANSGLRLPY